MAIADFSDWMDEHTGPHIIWYVKRLSANDTLANGSHQAGPYIPRELLLKVFPSLNQPKAENPDKWFTMHIDSHSGDTRQVRVVWYNNRLRGGTRNESRLTNLGGRESALLDPDSTGSLTIFAFHKDETGEASVCYVWVCDAEIDADLVEDRIGPIDPGSWQIWTVAQMGIDTHPIPSLKASNCWMEPHEIPEEWLKNFPSVSDIIRQSISKRPAHGIPVDVRLMKRRACEYEIFKSIEQAIELPRILDGFANIDEFISKAQTILQRRKSRSGRSLELQTREIFKEENLIEGVDFQHQPESENRKSPDYLFPNEAAYKDPQFPARNLRMLAVKTTCRDRWRQVLNEANRIEKKHLLTLQEGVSESQFREMTDANISLVVPAPLIPKYPQSIQPHLQSLESFIGDIRLLNLS